MYTLITASRHVTLSNDTYTYHSRYGIKDEVDRSARKSVRRGERDGNRGKEGGEGEKGVGGEIKREGEDGGERKGSTYQTPHVGC